MATINQIAFLETIKNQIKEPILIVGSKTYDYDYMSLNKFLNANNFNDITGIDILEGNDVDVIADMTNLENPYFIEKTGYFNTVFCMEVITHVDKPWLLGKNIFNMTKQGGKLIASECFVRKITRMPKDYYRFTFDGLAVIYEGFEFIENHKMKSLTRSKINDVEAYNNSVYEIFHNKTNDENGFGNIIRRFHRKFFGGKLFKISRLMPEQTFYGIAVKR
jgi:hypothetical protein